MSVERRPRRELERTEGMSRGSIFKMGFSRIGLLLGLVSPGSRDRVLCLGIGVAPSGLGDERM